MCLLNEPADGDGTRPGVKIEIINGANTVVRTVNIPRQAKGKLRRQEELSVIAGQKAVITADGAKVVVKPQKPFAKEMLDLAKTP